MLGNCSFAQRGGYPEGPFDGGGNGGRFQHIPARQVFSVLVLSVFNSCNELSVRLCKIKNYSFLRLIFIRLIYQFFQSNGLMHVRKIKLRKDVHAQSTEDLAPYGKRAPDLHFYLIDSCPVAIIGFKDYDV